MSIYIIPPPPKKHILTSLIIYIKLLMYEFFSECIFFKKMSKNYIPKIKFLQKSNDIFLTTTSEIF